MKLVPRTAKTVSTAQRPRLYFVHVPKTAGITLKTYLENNYAHGESLVVDEWKAGQLPPEELRKRRLLSGHYSSEVLDALGAPPDVTLMLVREPVERFRSWVAHCRRLGHSKYREMCEGRTDLEVLTGPDGYTCRQAHWVARALRAGAAYAGVPRPGELEGLLDRVDVPGVTEEIERFMQLVAFRMGWPAPQRGWHINRRPEEQAAPLRTAPGQVTDNEVRRHLAIDEMLYAMAKARFWSAYADMLTSMTGVTAPYTSETAAAVPLETVQEWLRRHHEMHAADQPWTSVEEIDITGDSPIAGEGWWWRERPHDVAYRWTGPEGRATIVAAPLEKGRDYALTIEAMGAADWPTWDGVGLEVNGQTIPVVHERFTPCEAESVTLGLHARLSPEVVGAQEGLTRITLTTARTTRALAHVRVEESFDTFHNDTRSLGLAVHRVQVRATTPRVRPTLALRRRSEAPAA